MRRNNVIRREQHVNVITESEHRKARHILNAIGHQVALMEARGYSKEQRDAYVFKILLGLESGRLNENFLETLGGVLGSMSDNKLLQPVMSLLGEKFAAALGLESGSFMHKIVVNFIENLEFSRFKEMLSGGSVCRPLVSELAGAVQEAVAEQGIQAFGLSPQSIFGKFFQETLLAAFAEDGIFVDKITDTVCSMNISDLMPGGASELTKAVPGLGDLTSRIKGMFGQ